MNYEQIAFFNHQLAGMLRSGIPLEGALAQLCEGLQQGNWRNEITQLEADLREGIPLAEAVERRKGLPEFYRHMLRLGGKGGEMKSTKRLLFR